MNIPASTTDANEFYAELLEYLKQSRHISGVDVVWSTPIRIDSYVNPKLPPRALEYTISVRCVVRRGNEVLVIRDPNGVHLLPGGHRENGETFEETLRREVLEESGWSIQPPLRFLGIRHMQHSVPHPPYPFPNHLQLVYCANAGNYHPEAREKDGYELGAAFYDPDQLATLPLSQEDRGFLQAAFTGPEITEEE
ncbi:NUDIX hydrolase [Ktedonospora formicarum]|uniref:Nudix hydrolase domain-containing protein n=1 Tax=Ktedonospora formicarum TaxID=2778364 RepID=A0A8J3IDR0_9CHLR|nr:NUDIX domain-containing protein [Ktedonospora formicarum]GHO49449.1 hypothetical protein KSX_76120 [Ktedonospora formicarum]